MRPALGADPMGSNPPYELSFGIPIAAGAFPTWESIMLGTIAYGILYYARSQVGI